MEERYTVKTAMRWIVEHEGQDVLKREKTINAMLADLVPQEESARKRMRAALSSGAGMMFYNMLCNGNGRLENKDIYIFRASLEEYLHPKYIEDIINTFLYAVSLPQLNGNGSAEDANGHPPMSPEAFLRRAADYPNNQNRLQHSASGTAQPEKQPDHRSLNEIYAFDRLMRGGFAPKTWADTESTPGHAEFVTGINYRVGINGKPLDYAQALAWLQKAANKGHLAAMTSIGYMYECGFGVQKDEKTAVNWYRKAACQGYANAQRNLGNMYIKGQCVQKDFAEGLKWVGSAAVQGDKNAICRIGVMYYYGEGLRQDYLEALKWCDLAVNLGSPQAMYLLATMYKSGEGVSQDHEKAMKLLRTAADQGFGDASKELGDYYFNGDGVQKDYAEALKWYRKAADQGSAAAINDIGFMYDHGYGMPQDKDKALEYFFKAANMGLAIAQRNVGLYHKDGIVVQQNMAEAIKWYRLASDQGDAEAKKQLEALLKS